MRKLHFVPQEENFIDLGISMCKWLRDDITRANFKGLPRFFFTRKRPSFHCKTGVVLSLSGRNSMQSCGLYTRHSTCYLSNSYPAGMKRAGCKTLFSGSIADPGALQWVNLTKIPQLPRYLPRWAHSPALYVSSHHAWTHST